VIGIATQAARDGVGFAKERSAGDAVALVGGHRTLE
jgi:hypothetical protein